MGVRRRMACRNLPKKLLRIRTALQLSQTELLFQMGFADRLNKSNISSYEHGRTEPPLPVLQAYAELAGVCPIVLIDDRLRLPKDLPAVPRHKSHD